LLFATFSVEAGGSAHESNARIEYNKADAEVRVARRLIEDYQHYTNLHTPYSISNLNTILNKLFEIKDSYQKIYVGIQSVLNEIKSVKKNPIKNCRTLEPRVNSKGRSIRSL